MKNYPTELTDLINTGHVNLCHTLFVDLSQPIRLTDLGRNIDINGDTYYSTGQLMSLDDLVFTTSIKINEIGIALTLSDPNLVGAIFGGDIINRRAQINRVFFDRAGAQLHIEQLWLGHIVGYSAEDNQDGPTITLTAASIWQDFERANSWTTSPDSHHRRDPADDIFKYAARSKEKIVWEAPS